MSGQLSFPGIKPETVVSSATGRRPLDLYPTDEAVTLALLARVSPHGRILEPCAGPGAMARVLARHPGVDAVVTSDVDPQHNTDLVADATQPTAVCWQQRPDWVVTNPPFNVALPILRNAMRSARVGVAFLVRLSFMEPAGQLSGDRGQFLAAHADRQVLSLVLGNPRPSFTGDGRTDSVTAVWLVWRRDWSWAAMGVPCPFVYAWDWRSSSRTAASSSSSCCAM